MDTEETVRAFLAWLLDQPHPDMTACLAPPATNTDPNWTPPTRDALVAAFLEDLG